MQLVGASAREIMKELLKEAIKHGNTSIFFHNQDLAAKLGITDLNFLQVCIKYLYDSQRLKYIRSDSGHDAYVEITSKGIDFAEGD